MARFIYEREGLTLVEVLVALAIATIVIAGSVAFYLMAHTAWIDCSKRAPLQRRASLAMEKMVRGINGRYGIREGRADTLNPVASDHLKITVDMDDSPTVEDLKIISFRRSGTQLIYEVYDADTLTLEEQFDMIPEKVSGLTFTESGSIVTIDLGMQDRVKDRAINVDLSSKVKIRN